MRLAHPNFSAPVKEVGRVVPGKEGTWGGISSPANHTPNEGLATVDQNHPLLELFSQLAEHRSILQHIHEVLPCYVQPQDGVKPEGEVLLHGKQAGFMPAGQPLAVLLQTGEVRPWFPPRTQGSIHSAPVCEFLNLKVLLMFLSSVKVLLPGFNSLTV